MRPYREIFLACVIAAAAVVSASAQVAKPVPPKPSASRPATAANDYRSSPAYADILVERTRVQVVIEDLGASYKDDFPPLVEARYELSLIDRDVKRLAAVKDLSLLTPALGKLILAKLEAEVALWKVRDRFQDAHPDTQRAKRKVDIYEKAVAEIIGS